MKHKPDLEKIKKIKQDFVDLLGEDYCTSIWETDYQYGFSVGDKVKTGICTVVDDMHAGLKLGVDKNATQEVIEAAKKIAKKYDIFDSYMISPPLPALGGAGGKIVKEHLKYKE